MSDKVLQEIASGFETGAEDVLGRPTDAGPRGHFDDLDVRDASFPLRAVQVTYDSGLSDCIIGLSSMREEHLKSALAAGARQIADRLGVEADIASPLVYEFEDVEDALEQLEALYNEATVSVSTPVGEMLLIVGSGLVEAANRVLYGSQPAAGGDLDEFEALAAEAGIGTAGAAPAAGVGVPGTADTAAANMAAMAAAGVPQGAQPAGVIHDEAHVQRWSHLLSGVEIELSAELGRTEMALGELASLRSDSVLTLDQMVDEPVTVYVNGARYAHARLVVVDDEYGVEILEVLEEAAVPAR